MYLLAVIDFRTSLGSRSVRFSRGMIVRTSVVTRILSVVSLFRRSISVSCFEIVKNRFGVLPIVCIFVSATSK